MPSIFQGLIILECSLLPASEICYGSVKNGFDSAILTKIPRVKKEEGLGRRQTTKCGAKRQARSCPDHATTKSDLCDTNPMQYQLFGTFPNITKCDVP